MNQTFKQCSAALLSFTIFMVGIGFMNTLVPTRLNIENVGTWGIGIISAGFFVGLISGSISTERFIVRVGHIRAYATFATGMAIVTVLMGFFFEYFFWFGLRLIFGFLLAALYIVIESWLLASSTEATRGKVLAWYMIALYASQGIGQLIIKHLEPTELITYCIAMILCAASIFPLALTSVSMPEFEEPSALKFSSLYNISPSGVIGCFVSGIIVGSFYGMFPEFVLKAGFTKSDLGWIMLTVFFGGAILQYPTGYISDKIDRRLTMIAVCLLNTLACLGVIFCASHPFLFYVSLFFFGGFMFVIYPLAISHACDYLDSKDIVAATQGLLLAFSVGCIFGPLISPIPMKIIGPDGLLVFMGIASIGLAAFFTWRSTQGHNVPVAEQEDFVAIPTTSLISSELDPRGE